jgi:hypothetical protein
VQSEIIMSDGSAVVSPSPGWSPTLMHLAVEGDNGILKSRFRSVA